MFSKQFIQTINKQNMEAVSIKAFPVDTSQIEALEAFMKALKIKFEVSKETPYNPEFVAKIEESMQQSKEGKTRKIALDEIWK